LTNINHEKHSELFDKQMCDMPEIDITTLCLCICGVQSSYTGCWWPQMSW